MRKAIATNEKQLRSLNGYRRLRDELEKTEGDIAAAKSQMKFLNLIKEKVGKSELIAKMPIILSGFKTDIDGSGRIASEATHSLNSGGLGCRVTLETKN